MPKNDKSTSQPTIKEVAERAQVALSSVSRVVNDHPDVSYRMRERVRRAIHDLGYEPNLIAASLRSGSTNTIGFVVSDIANPLFADITWGAERRLEEAGYSMVLTNSEGQPEREERMARLLRWRRVDGLILSLADESRTETLVELQNFEAPIVLLDRDRTGIPNASAVLADHASGLERATDLLLKLGHRRIALVSGSQAILPGRERLRGFTAAHEHRGLTPRAEMIRLGPLTPEFGESSVMELMHQDPRPTALICGGNTILVGALRALRRQNLKVGEDVSLVSCDDVPLAELHYPSITVVDRDTIGMGEIAANLMIERLRSKDAKPRVVTVPTRLVVRDSTTPVSTFSSE
jgi:LacI family transcriptional regulator